LRASERLDVAHDHHSFGEFIEEGVLVLGEVLDVIQSCAGRIHNVTVRMKSSVAPQQIGVVGTVELARRVIVQRTESS
jgi:hypothetical protein